MATYVNDLRLKEIATGDEAGTWGTSTNTNLELIGEALGYGTQQVFSSDADATTTVADGASDPARAMYFKITSAGNLTATRTCTIAPNTVSRVMFIENATSGSQSINISQGSGANVTIATGKTAVVYLDGAGSGAAVVDAMALVDPGVTDTLAEVLTAGNTSSGTNIELTTTDKVQFRGSAIYLNSSTDGQLDIVADTEVQIAATTIDINGNVDISGTAGVGGVLTANAGVKVDNITIDGTEIDLSSGDLTLDVAGDIVLDADGGDVFFKDAGTTFGSATNTSGNLIIKSGTTTAATFSGANVTFAGTIAGGGTLTTGGNVVIPDAGNIGSASDTDAIAISSGGVVTFSQAPVFPDGSIAVADLDIDGATDIGADLVDADLFIVDDGAGGTNRKVAASRIKTYIGGGTQWQAVKTGNYTAAAGQGVFANTTSSSFTITLPAGTLGDEVTIVDYAGTFDSNALTVAANGSEKIFGSTDDLTVSTERAAFTLVFTDSTQGWLFKND